MVSALDWLLVGGYFALTIVVTLYASRRVKNLGEFTVGGRRSPTPIVFAGIAASFIGGGYTMGIAAKGFEHGFAYLLVPLAFTAQTILVGSLVAPRLQRYADAATVGEVFRRHYGVLAQLFAGALSFLYCAGIAGVIARAGGVTLESLTGLPLVWGIVIVSGAVIVYSTAGGMWASIQSDVLQFVFLALAIPLFALFLLFGEPGGTTSIAADMAALDLPGLAGPALFGAILGFFLGETLVPPYTQRAFTGNAPTASRRGFVLAGVFSLAWFVILVVIGLVGRTLSPDVEPDAVLITLIKDVAPAGLKGLLIASIGAILMSTQDSFLNSASTTFALDFVKPLRGGRLSDKTALGVARWSTVVVGVLGVLFALTVPSLIDALLYCYTLWAPTVVLPLVIAVMGVRVRPEACVAACLAGGLVTGVWLWGLGEPGDWPALVPGVVANQVVFWSIHVVCRNRPMPRGLFAPLVREIGEER